MFGLYLKDDIYRKRFVEFIQQNLKCSIRIFTNYQQVTSLESDRIKLLLTDDLQADFSNCSFHVLYLCDYEVDNQDEDHIYKYQSMDRIIALIKEKLSEGDKYLWDSFNHNYRMVGIYSPVGRCCKTALAQIMGEIMGEKYDVFLLNCEEFSGDNSFSDEKINNENGSGIWKQGIKRTSAVSWNLSDIVLYLQQMNQLPEENGIFESKGVYDSFSSVYCPEDVRYITSQQIINVIGHVVDRKKYQIVIADYGRGTDDLISLLDICDLIIVPGTEEIISKRKIDAFRHYINGKGREDLFTKMEFCNLKIPKTAEKDFMHSREFYDEIKWSEFGEQAQYFCHKLLEEQN